MAPVKILLVDDLPENLLALETLLRQPGVEIVKSLSGREALELLLAHDFAVAVIDVQMPEMDGFELAELMRGTGRTRAVPIIFVTAGARTPLSTFRGYESGAVDFLYKPLDPHIVRSKVQVFLELARKTNLIEEKLAETKDLLRQRNEALQSRDEFLSIASHELKTPLTSLLLQLQMMGRLSQKLQKEGTEEGAAEFFPKVDRALALAVRQSTKLSDLLDELLDLTRIRLGKLTLSKESVNLAQLARESFERFRNETTEKKIEFALECPEKIPASVDAIRIEQVFNNLISNAIKYGEGKPVRLVVEAPPKSGAARIAIRDQGQGVPADLQEKIFQRFERAVSTDQISGLGLGLYITRQIVEAHGGKISVESEPGKGTEFTVDLPLA